MVNKTRENILHKFYCPGKKAIKIKGLSFGTFFPALDGVMIEPEGIMEKEENKEKKTKNEQAQAKANQEPKEEKGPESAGGRGYDELDMKIDPSDQHVDQKNKSQSENRNFEGNRDFVRKQDMHHEEQRMYAGAGADESESGHSLGGDISASAKNFGDETELEKDGTSDKEYQAYKENKYPDEGNLHSDYNEYDSAGSADNYSGSGNRAVHNRSTSGEDNRDDSKPETNQQTKKKKGPWKNPY
jgi:hypothetical protein